MISLSRLKTYFTVYFHLVGFSLKTVMEYRLSFITRFLYAPAYTGVLYLLSWIAFTRAPFLGGWSMQEGLLLASMLHVMMTFIFFFFFKGTKNFLWFEVREGLVDFYLVKPINTQFMITLSRPDIDTLLSLFIWPAIVVWQAQQLSAVISATTMFWAVVTFILGLLIAYFTVTTYATLGFYVTKAQQITEFYDKAADFGQYPLSIFGESIQLAMFTIVPAAYYGYLPVSILLGKTSPNVLWWSVGWLLLMIVVNQWAWRRALKQYSSASS